MAGLLNIGEMGSLAMHTLVRLAALRRKDPEARLTVQELADELQASVHTLRKVARRLAMLELVEGARGAGGGVRLTRAPEDINLMSIIEGVEGKLASNGCLFAKRVCAPGGGCLFQNITGDLERMVRDYFVRTTVADLLPRNT